MEPDYYAILQHAAEQAHPGVQAIVKYFSYDHLKGVPRSVSQEFCKLAANLVAGVEGSFEALEGPELTVALRKLLEGKDAAVRASLPI